MPAAASLAPSRSIDAPTAGDPTEVLRRWQPSARQQLSIPVGATPPAPRSGLRFGLLGTLQAVGPAGPVELGGPRQRATLAMLLLRASQTVPLDRLIDDVWAGNAPRSAVTTIRGYLSHLRVALGSGVVVTERPGYRACVDPDSIDALRFERLVAEGRRTGDPVAASAILAEALALWRGPALIEFDDLPAVAPFAQRLAELQRTALEAFHEAELACGRHDEMVARLQAAVAEQPLREQRWRQLMVAYYRCGRQSEALRAYQDVRAVLADELGLEPGPELVALEAAILDQRPELLGEKNGAPEEAERSRPPAGNATGHFSPSVGRQRERAELGVALRGARQGRGGLALVTGDAGIGKSHLVGELATAAAADGIRVVWGHCHDRADAPPFWPWTEALRSVRPAALATGGLSTLLGPVDPADPGSRFRLFDAVATALADEAVTAGGLLVVLEDLQWADRGSLLLLELVARRLAHAPVLVVATACPLEVAPEDWSRLEGAAALRLALGGLEPADVAALMDVPEELAARLHRRSGGNPFVLRELGRLPQHGAEDGDVPPPVRQLALRRCDGLADDARRVLQVAAVMGPRFEFEALAAVTAMAPPALLDVLDAALSRGIVVEDRPVGAYRFTHELMCEALRGELSRHRRAFVHRAIAEALDTPSSEPGEVARHYCAGVAAGADLDRAVTWTLTAARHCVAALAYEAAAACCGSALDAFEGTGVAAETEVRLLLEMGDAWWRAGDVAQARGRFLDAVDRARACDDPSWLAMAVLGIGGGLFRDWHATSGDARGQMRGLLEEALARSGAADSHLRVRLLGHLAEELYFERESDLRRALSAEAVAGARRLGDAATLGFALQSRIQAVWDPDGAAERRELADELLAVAERVGSVELALAAHHHLVVAALELADPDTAWASLAALEAAATANRLPLHQWTATWLRALQALLAGDLAGGEELAGAAFELGSEAHDPDAFNIFATQVGLVRLEQGRAEEVVGTIEALAVEFPELPGLRVAECLLHVESGRLDQARIELRGLCAGELRALPEDFSRLASLAMLAEAAALLGDADTATTLYRALWPYRRRVVLAGDRHCWGSAEHYLGLLAVTRGEPARAAGHFEVALAVHGALGARSWLAHTQGAYGRLLEAQGDPRARVLLREARATARDLGLVRLRSRVG